MSEPMNEGKIGQDRRDQMLKLVSKGFYKELVNYGVEREEILRVASHLLDNVMSKEGKKEPGVDYYDNLFTIADVQDHWETDRYIQVGDTVLTPLVVEQFETIVEWLDKPGIRELFVPAFPETSEALRRTLLDNDDAQYFSITCEGSIVGMIGGENIDRSNLRLEMKKLVGDPEVRGRGVGKRATFAFLYYAFKILGMHKVFVHSRDINIRNINLNSKFGFVLEGIFLEDQRVGTEFKDVVRMALFESFWSEIFSPVE